MTLPSPRLRRRGEIRERGQVVFLILVLLAIGAGGCWLVLSSRKSGENEARRFATEAATRLALHHDAKFLDHRIGPKSQVLYPPAWRSRMFDRLKSFGTPAPPIEVKGEVRFTSGFFSPVGVFQSQLNYPGMPAFLHLTVSNPSGRWQIDEINLRYHLAPQ